MKMDAQPVMGRQRDFMGSYLEALALIERLHRLLLDVIKDEFERVGVLEINAVQALLLFNIGDNEVTAGELKSRGYYQGSNVSYNLKRFVKECRYSRYIIAWKLCTTMKAADVTDTLELALEASGWSGSGPIRSAISIDRRRGRDRHGGSAAGQPRVRGILGVCQGRGGRVGSMRPRTSPSSSRLSFCTMASS